MIQILLLVSIVSGFVFAMVMYERLRRADPGDEGMVVLAGHIRSGALTFLRREYTIMAVVGLLIIPFLYYLRGIDVMTTFIIGALTSGFAGFLGLFIATKANVCTASAAKTSLNKAFTLAFSSASVTGITVVSLGLLALTFTSTAFSDVRIWFGLSFGASLVAFFARVGGGIFTKSADMAADYVGKVEESIPEDDPRNPAVIADNVGDNVGDVAGMSADLFESYLGCLVAAAAIGSFFIGDAGVQFPLVIAAVGLFASIMGSLTVRAKEAKDVGNALHLGLGVSNVIVIAASYFVSSFILGNLTGFWTITIGAIAGTGIGLATEYFTATRFMPVKTLAKACQSGAASVIVEGLATAMMSSVLPLLIITSAIALAFQIGGLYGVALGAVGMLSTLGISLGIDAFGPTVDNAGGIAQMSHMDPEVRERTDVLDAVGNTTAAIGKGFAIGSAALTALAFFFTYATRAQLNGVDLATPRVIIGLLLGGLVPFVFCSLTIQAVGRSAFEMVDVIRGQFRGNPKILEGTEPPNYTQCIDIAARSALKSMVLPGVLALFSPLAVKAFIGTDALAGFLAGALSSGLLLAIVQANAGGAWDNAKKSIEAGQYGGVGSPAHKAAVVGDTVGDPLKDTSGPSINILIKLMSIVALLSI